MADKTMPERITVHGINNGETFPGNVCVTELKPGALLPDNIDECEYVRTDIAAGDTNEPLDDGQYRWCRVNEGEDWEPVAIKVGFNDRLVYCITGEEQDEYVEDCYEMGPVIRPPADTAN